MSELKIRAEVEDDRIGFLIWKQIEENLEGSGCIFVVEDMTFEEKPDTWTTVPTGTLSKKEATELMNSLWKCGIRPTETGSNYGKERVGQ